MNFWSFLTFVAAAAMLMTKASSEEIDWASVTCKQTADVIFAVDTSSSIWPPHFNKNIKSFIKGIISNFNVGPGPKDSRIGLILFSTRVFHEFRLKDFSKIRDIEYHINRRMFYRGGSTNTHKALNYIAKDMLLPQNGRRKNVTTLVIVITDGASNSPDKTKVASDFLKTKGVEVFAIGIGSNVKDEELNYIASDPHEDFVFNVKSFNTIGDIEKRFANQTCKALKAAATTTTSTTTTTTTTTTSTTTTTTPTTTTTVTTPTTTTPITTTTTTPTTTTTATPTTTTTTTTPTTTTTTTPTTTPTTTARPSTSTATTTTTTTPSTTTTTHPASSTPTKAVPKTKITTDERPIGDQPIIEECQGKPADIYFLLDASSSVWIGHFHNRVLPFVRSLVRSFEISPMKTRVGLVTFSDEVDHVFNLAKHRNLKSLNKSLQPENVAYLTGGTNTGDAISFVTDHGLGDGVARKDVAKIIITVTDGLSQRPLKTKKAAQRAREQGILMFAIGVGKQVDDAELSSIASDPDEDFVFTVESFRALSSITERLAKQTCRAVAKVTGNGSNKDKKLDCSSKPLNVMFLYEYLNSVQNARKVLDHVISGFATKTVLHTSHSKIGVMTQPCVGGNIDMMPVYDFQISLTERSVNHYVTLADIVRQLRKDSFKSGNLNAGKKVAVIVVDDHTQDRLALRKEARRLKFQGVQVIVIAVAEVDEKLLESIVSYPTEHHIVRVDSYADLEHSEINLIERMCDSQEGMFKSDDITGHNRNRAVVFQSVSY